jgi:hypothetical protein
MAEKTIRQQPITNAHLTDAHLYLVAGTPTWSALYVPVDETGAKIGEPRTIGGPVAYDPGLWAWVDTVIVASANAKEGT